MPTVELKTSADNAALISAYDAMLRKQDETIKKLREGARESREAGKHTVSLSGFALKAAADIGAMAAGYFTVSTAARLFTQELQAHRELSREILQLNQDLAAPAGRASRATAGLFDPAELQRRVSEIAGQTGVGEKDIFAAFAAPGAVGQRIGPEALTESVRTAARMTATFGDDIELLTKSLAQLSEAGGAAPESIAGFLLRNRKSMNLEDFAPGMVSAVEAGGTLEEAGEFTKFFDRAAPKIRGGAAKLTADLFQTLMQEQVFPREEVTAGGKLGVAFRSLAEIAPQAEGVTEALRIYRESLAAIAPEEREGVLGRLLVGQGGARAQLRNLLTGEPGAMARMAEIQAAVLPPGEADRGVLAEAISRAGKVPSVSLGKASALARTQAEIEEAGQVGGGFEALALNTIDEFLRIQGAGTVHRKLTGLMTESAIETPEQAIGALETLRQDISGPRRGFFTGGGVVPGFQGVNVEAIDQAERQKREESLTEMVRLMRGQLAEQRRTNAILGEARAVIPYGEN